MSEYTKGPWTMTPALGLCDDITVGPIGGEPVTFVLCGGKDSAVRRQQLANAMLIHAAPDLLESAIAVIEGWNAIVRFSSLPGLEDYDFHQFQKLREAITKAGGL